MSHKSKVCALCGKSEATNWARHWRNQHPSSDTRELIPGEVPTQPFDESWLYLIKPLSLREIYERAANNENIQSPADTDSNVTMPTPMAEGHSHLSTKYIEINVESDDQEESKLEIPTAKEDDFTDLPT